MKRGNFTNGSQRYNALLSEDEVKEIKKLLNNNLSVIEIASKFNVDRSVIFKIKRNITWRHVVIQ